MLLKIPYRIQVLPDDVGFSLRSPYYGDNVDFFCTVLFPARPFFFVHYKNKKLCKSYTDTSLEDILRETDQEGEECDWTPPLTEGKNWRSLFPGTYYITKDFIMQHPFRPESEVVLLIEGDKEREYMAGKFQDLISRERGMYVVDSVEGILELTSEY